MAATLRLQTTVLPGNRVEVHAPSLPEGAKVEVLVVLATAPLTQYSSALDYLDSLPFGPRAFTTWDEYEQHLREERNAWDR